MSGAEAATTEPESTEPTEAEGQAAGGAVIVVKGDGEGLAPRSLDEAVELLATDARRWGHPAVLRTIAIWIRDWKEKGEQITVLRETVASLKAEKKERERHKILVTVGQTAGPVIAASGLELMREDRVGLGLALVITGVALLLTALWVNRGDPA